LKAKAYIDVAVEKGLGKVLAGLLIWVFVAFLDYRSATWLAVGLSIVWCLMAWAAKRQYVAVLATSIRGRFANLEGGFASLTERSTLAMVEAALRSDDAVEVAFGLDLVEQAGTVDAKHLADELELLLGHADEEIRVRSVRLLARFPELAADDVLREALQDPSDRVAEASVGAVVAACPDEQAVQAVIRELLGSPHDRVRLAALSWLLHADTDGASARRLAAERVEALMPRAEAGPGLVDALGRLGGASRRELAVAGGLLDDGALKEGILSSLLADADETVSGLAIATVGRAGSTTLRNRLVSMLADPSARGRVKEGLVSAGPSVVAMCAQRLGDATEAAGVRARLAQVLAHIPEQGSVAVLEQTLGDAKAPWEVRYAALKALSKLRVSEGADLDFHRETVFGAVDTMVEEAARYLMLGATLERARDSDSGQTALLRTGVWEAWGDRREAVFRLLGLVYAPDDVYRSHGTLGGSDDRKKANALEWLERTLGHGQFGRVLPVLDGRPSITAATARGPDDFVQSFAADSDPWIAQLASRSTAAGSTHTDAGGTEGMDVISKAFLLQKVDLLEGARSAHLGLLATIAEEVEVDAGEILIEAGEPNDALYVIVRGSAELGGVGDHKLAATDGTAFGTWSLIDSAPSIVGARATERTRLLRITRSDFHELLGDHPELATGMLQALARRLRSLVA
ncbi:MAG: cyclic nucleotide-binding domain-containing protein, partial [Gemmatimonadota bacterium]|nr:cyclic nucleotide-binding domain-containing protein [Gemmatimonadota bacterium]